MHVLVNGNTTLDFAKIKVIDHCEYHHITYRYVWLKDKKTRSTEIFKRYDSLPFNLLQ